MLNVSDCCETPADAPVCVLTMAARQNRALEPALAAANTFATTSTRQTAWNIGANTKRWSIAMPLRCEDSDGVSGSIEPKDFASVVGNASPVISSAMAAATSP